MGGRLTIRWTRAARSGAVAAAAIGGLALLAGALEPPRPDPLPADLGLGPTVSSAAVPPPVAEARGGHPTRGRHERPGPEPKPRKAESPAPGPPAEPEAGRRPPADLSRRSPAAPPVAPRVAAAPAPAPAPAAPQPAPAPAPVSPPQPAPPAEFGFER